ncbi:MAG: beta-ketoacyl-ACP synthase [Pseudomonadota bacterium]
MATENHPVLITGIGLLSSHGEGPQAHLDAMAGGKPVNVDTERFAPYPVHALGEVDWSQQISRRDMRQMEPWQRIGTYAAGLALDDAGAKGDEDLCGRMDMIVAAGGGERDVEVDSSVMADARTANDREALLNERLSNDLRPTLFLAQLSNLLAGNISIVHKVTGSSRTFMGEEGAGISSIRTAFARVQSGQSDIVLVGGAFNGEREDMLLLFELGHYLTKDELLPVWSREGHTSGFAQGSIGAFVVLESAEHANKRGAKAYAQLDQVIGEHGRRKAGAGRARLNDAWNRMPNKDFDGVMSGATGASPCTATEASWLHDGLPDLPVRAFGSVFGHGVEAQFPLGIALAALSVHKGEMPPPFEAAERSAAKPATAILVTGMGHHRSEGLGVVTKLDDQGASR